MKHQQIPLLALVVVVVVFVGCSVVATPAQQPTPTHTPDIPATVEAVVNLRLSELPTITPAPTPTILPTATLVATPTLVPTSTNLPQATSTPRPTPTPTFSQVTTRIRNAIVRIDTPDGTGSGTIINSGGDILTNYHVIKGFNTVSVRINDAVTVTGIVVGFHELLDIAIVNVGFRPLTFMPLSNRRPDIGEEITTIGYPRVDLVGSLGGSTVTRGIVSAIRRIDGQMFIQTDAAINPGNSGGAAIDRYGNFVGIPTAKFIEADNFGLLIPGFDIGGRILQLKSGFRLALPTPTPVPLPTPTRPPSWSSYYGSNFSITYPSGWILGDGSTDRQTFSSPTELAYLQIHQVGSYGSLTIDVIADILLAPNDSATSVRRSSIYRYGVRGVQVSIIEFNTVWECVTHRNDLVWRIGTGANVFLLSSWFCEDIAGVSDSLFQKMLSSFSP